MLSEGGNEYLERPPLREMSAILAAAKTMSVDECGVLTFCLYKWGACWGFINKSVQPSFS